MGMLHLPDRIKKDLFKGIAGWLQPANQTVSLGCRRPDRLLMLFGGAGNLQLLRTAELAGDLVA